ncbi:MAG: CDP-glycerol glycerophosphotransferase family protein [Clostridium sp.]|nr:CDP-glycerol glycerophosphotransferase family protein [Clostridium sp.]
MIRKIEKMIRGFIKHALLCLPINPRIMMFYAHDRRGICCNPKYIMYGLIREQNRKYRLYWVSDYPKTVPISKDYRVIKRRSFLYYYIFARTRIFITNDMLDELLIKKKGQIIINTWHGGGAFKKAGYDLPEADERKELLDKWYGRTDYMIASSEYLAHIFMKAFHLQESRILKTGMPRCDIFFKDNSFYREIRERYRLDIKVKILLYAPTYRYEKYELLNSEEIEKALDALKDKTGEDWVCLFRAHQFDRQNNLRDSDKRILNCSDYIDVQELLCATDLLISDYSSLLWEFSLRHKPVISYAKSPRQYADKERPFYMPYEKWPYIKVKNIDELLQEITRLDDKKYISDMEEFNRFLGTYEDGQSTQRVLAFLESI